MLKSQTELAKMINELPGTGDMLRAASAHPAPTTEQVEGDENRWAMAGPEDPLVREILSNDLARAWRSVQRDHPWFTEVIVTDVRGRLVAATGKPTHYRQASQKWWAEYQARRYDSSVLYLPPAITPRRRGAALMMNLYRPIWHGHTSAAVRPGTAGSVTTANSTKPGRQEVVGVCKITMDATWFLDEIFGSRNGRSPGTLGSRAWLVDYQGSCLHGFGDAAPADTLPETLFEKLRSGGGWAVDDAIPGFELVGFAPVSSPVLMPDFGVVVAAPRDGVALPIYDRARLILVVAIGMVAAVVLVAASILRRIENRLSRASN